MLQINQFMQQMNVILRTLSAMPNRSTLVSPGFNAGRVCTYADSEYLPMSRPSHMTPLNDRDCSQSMPSGGPDIAASSAFMVKLNMPKGRGIEV
jgi:hypothetical protein